MKQALLTYRRPLLGLLAPLIFVLSLLFSACQDPKPSSPAELLQARQALQTIDLKAGPAVALPQLDSLEHLAKKYQDDSLTFATRLKRAELYLGFYELAPADSILSQLRVEVIPHPALHFSLCAQQSIAELIRDDIAQAISYQRQAITIAEKYPEQIDQSTLNSLYINTSLSYSYTDKADSMSYFLSKGYELAKKRGDSIRLAHCYAQEGAIYSNAFDDEKCAEYLSKAIDILRTQSPKNPNRNVYRLNLGQTLYNDMKSKGVTQARLDSIEGIITEMISSETKTLKRDYIMGHGHKILGYIYTANKRYPEAEKHLLIADSLSEDPTIKSEINKIHLLIMVERGDKTYEAEAKRLEASLAGSIISPSALMESYRILRRAYAEMGKTEEALRLNDSIDKYQDSIRAENKYREVAKLDRGRALKEAKAQVQSERRGKHQLLWWLAGTGLVACLAIATLYIYNRRRRHRLEEECRLLHESLAQSQEEQERSAKNLELIKEKMRQTMRQEEQEASPSEGQRLKLSTEAQETIAEGLREFVQGRGYLDKSLSLDSLSELIGTNRAYLSAYLNQVLGCSYSDYVAKLRLEEAKRLLLETDYTIETIALSTGFTVKVTFINAFKKHNDGLTPSAYRSRHRSSLS